MPTPAVNLKTVISWACEYNAKLRADDKRFRKSVQIHAEDGSYFFWKNAFLVTRGVYSVVLAEHYSAQVFAADELTRWEMFAYDR